MNDIPADIVYEISRYLGGNDFLAIRLVWKNITDDLTSKYVKYLHSLIRRKDVNNPLLKQMIHIKEVADLLKKPIKANIPDIYNKYSSLPGFNLYVGAKCVITQFPLNDIILTIKSFNAETIVRKHELSEYGYNYYFSDIYTIITEDCQKLIIYINYTNLGLSNAFRLRKLN